MLQFSVLSSSLSICKRLIVFKRLSTFAESASATSASTKRARKLLNFVLCAFMTFSSSAQHATCEIGLEVQKRLFWFLKMNLRTEQIILLSFASFSRINRRNFTLSSNTDSHPSNFLKTAGLSAKQMVSDVTVFTISITLLSPACSPRIISPFLKTSNYWKGRFLRLYVQD